VAGSPAGRDGNTGKRIPWRNHAQEWFVVASQADVVAVLRSHGLSGAAAAALWKLAGQLLRDTRCRGLEHSVMIDINSGAQIGPMLRGNNHQIDVSAQLRAVNQDVVCAHFHTHPGSSAFSDADGGFLVSWPFLKVIVVAALDGRWYAMSKLPDASAVAPIDLVTAFRRELLRLLDDSQVARRERPDVIWSRISHQFGLRYDVVGETHHE
jgi:proteasome lid subunit RPN8/RPN11